MSTGDVYRCNLVFEDTGLGKTYHTGFSVRQDGASFDFNAIGEAGKSFWNDVLGVAAVKSWYRTEMVLKAVTAQRVKPFEDLVQTYTTGLPIAGTSTADALAQQLSPLLSHRSVFTSRSKRGRSYLPAPNEVAEAEPGWWDSDFTTDVIAAWDESIMQTGGIGVLLTPVVYSKALDDAFDVDHFMMDRRIRTQRRRQATNAVYISP